ncbi:lytic transglycosylase domain-containing protein [Arenibaculum pallidiluteum]|uniref:lytic transglycosylase domain-containing protein n=1 Tax=Arenibaculum pallidiluteum TaxID=2812559 RepID=UPI001A969D03|nr:lytic transglycosylase domain-containing protein [Arenibaculum pallidiluteum]
MKGFGNRWARALLCATLLATAPGMANAAEAPAKSKAAASKTAASKGAGAKTPAPAKKTVAKAAALVAAPASPRMERDLAIWTLLMGSGAIIDFEEMAEFLAAHHHWPGQIRMRTRMERVLPSAWPTDRVLAYFQKNPPVSTAGVIRAAAAQEEAGDRAAADALLRDHWVAGDLDSAEQASFLTRFADRLRPSEHRRRLDRLVWDGETEAAKRMLGLVDAAHGQLAIARLDLAAGRGDARGILSALPPAVQDDPGLLFARARWHRLKGDSHEAAELLAKQPQDPDRPDQWWSEREAAARDIFEGGDARRAYAVVNAHRLAQGRDHVQAQLMAAWLATAQLGHHADALRHAEAAFSDPAAMAFEKVRASYWAGRAAEALGNKEAAARWYQQAGRSPGLFHGQLALVRLDPTAVLPNEGDPDPTPQEEAAFERKDLTIAARVLDRRGRGDQAALFVRRAMEEAESPTELTLVAALARSIDRTDLQIAVARKAARHGHLLGRSGYPTLANQTGIQGADPALVHAIIRQESSFAAQARSPVGAAGLMQVMPDTAAAMAKRIGAKHSAKALHQDPAHNLRLGSTYLADLLRQYDGSVLMAAAAYNAGPGRVRSWVNWLGDPRERSIDVADWVESIPYKETRNYVQRVLEATLVYRTRLSGNAARVAPHVATFSGGRGSAS